MDERTLGKKLQLARRRAGLTQQQLCQKADLSYSTLAKIERGAIRSPSVFTVSAIALATNTPLEVILGLDAQNESPTLQQPKKRSKSGISFVYFDVNGVLVRFFHRAFPKIAEAAGLSPDVVETIFWRYNDAACRGQLSLEDFNHKLGQEYGLPDFDWQQYYLESGEEVPGIRDFVEWAAQHYEVGLLTNNMPGFVDSLKECKMIPDIKYTSVVDSSKVGSIKPETQIFDTALQLANVKANEVLLVDDTRPNLIAADKLGWQVLLFDDFEPAQSIERAKKALEF